jgi:hypothetical protein
METTLPGLERQAEIDVGYDYVFEQRWCTFERGVWAFFTLLIAAGLAGVFGRGPLNEVKLTLNDGTSVRYERVVRFKSPTVTNFEIPVSNGIAELEANTSAVKKLGLQQVIPQPTRTFGSEHVGPVQFQVVAPQTKTVFMQLAMQPSGLGPVTSSYRVNGQTTVQIKQFVLP